MNKLPMLLYTFPRARGTVSLLSSNRAIKLNEPFAVSNVFDFKSPPHNIAIMPSRTEADIAATLDWDVMISEMNSPDSCTKIHGSNLDAFRPGKKWYNSVMELGSHAIFVIERPDRENQMLSVLLANRHGFSKEAQDKSPIYSSMVTNPELFFLRQSIRHHLAYYPVYGEVVTYDTLPAPDFDRNIVSSLENQHSELRHKCLLNLEYCKEVIADQLAYYKEEWDDKIRNIRPNK